MAVGWRKDYVRYQRYFSNLFAVYKNRDDVKALLEIILSLATITFFVAFALRPTIITITHILKDISTKEETLETLKRKRDNLDQAQNLYNQQIDRILLLDDSVPKNTEVEKYVRQIESISLKSNVLLTNLKIEETTIKGAQKPVQKSKTEELEELPPGSSGFSFSSSANGNYSQLIAFLENIENLRRPIWIDETNLILIETDEGSTRSLMLKGRVAFEGEGVKE